MINTGSYRYVHRCFVVWLVLTILVMVETPAVSPAQQPKVDLRRETIISQALAGNLLGDPTERTLYVLLPPGYATSDRRYPVVYVTVGGDGKPGRDAFRFKMVMQTLLGKGEIKEMIVVVPDGTNKFRANHFRSSPTLGDYETYVTQEVVGYVDTHYRTRPTRDSRGFAGCGGSGGSNSMRLGLKYPTVFSVVAATDGSYDDSPEVWPSYVRAVRGLTELPRDFSDLMRVSVTRWYIQMAAGAAPNPDNPPFYCDMPVRIVDGRGEFVPEVMAKIVETDAAHEARRYVQQPVRLRGILLRYGVYDTFLAMPTHSFVHVLTDLGIEHEYVEVEAARCSPGWEAVPLQYMSDMLTFEDE